LKILIQAAVVTLFAASTAQAQQAVQWKVSDGGNGHWYACLLDASGMTVSAAASRASIRGAHLFTGCSAEFDFAVHAANALNPTGWVASGNHLWGPWIGLRRDETSGEFSWADSANCTFDRWDAAAGQPDPANEDAVLLYSMSTQPVALCHDLSGLQSTRSAIIEWSADCNGDGIVDYGQCRDGSLPDANGNNIPECCENDQPCVVGNYPVQWRVADGGNGHWYVVDHELRRWSSANTVARDAGGHAVAITSASENHFVGSISAFAQSGAGAWAGGYQTDGGCGPNCAWTWTNGDPWSFTNWWFGTGEPNDQSGDEPVLEIFMIDGLPRWFDAPDSEGYRRATVIEWSADCNNDGIVDKGQILLGQLPDSNNNGIPDPCEVPTCRDADIFRDFNVNGADLGILLSQWGPNTPLTRSDLNRDGAVDGADLGIFLSFWGPCP
jgi:hypothetical protein